MTGNYRFSIYDLIKVVLIVVFASFLYVIFNPASQPESIARASLPAEPPANFTWKYDSISGELLNPQGVPIYSLSADGDLWQPVIPVNVQLELPRDYRLIQSSSGNWQILDTGGNGITAWDSDLLQWSFDLDAVHATKKQTIAITPSPIPSATPTPTRRSIFAATFTPTPSLTPTESCSTKIVSRLKVGQSAIALENLRVHSTPQMIQNIIKGIPRDEVVTVVAGPVCEPYQGGAYVWWEINSGPGVIGWVVEAALNGSFYFLEPVE